MDKKPFPRRTGARPATGRGPARSRPTQDSRTPPPARDHRPRGPALPPLAAGTLGEALLVASDGLAAVLKGYALNDGLLGLWQAYPDLLPATRGAVQDLLYGTLRDCGRGSFILAKLLSKPLEEPRIEALLLLALYRLETRPDTAHTVVDQAVEAAARLAEGRLKALVNGVLRNALRQWAALLAAADADPAAHWRHAAWWIKAVQRQHPEHWQALLAANNTHPPMSLRVNPRRSSADAYRAELTEAAITFTELAPLALQLDTPRPVSSLPGFAEGRVSVQDWGAQQAAALLDLAAGQRVLDACAAPGGKTAHLLESADIALLALDVEDKRSQRVRDNLARLGLSAEVRTADCRHLDEWWNGQPFERILADVPCSASGVARRHPDIKWLRREEDIAGFATVQAEILEALWQVLAPGGKMLYLTCSVFEEENGRQVARFAARHKDCRRARLPDGTFERHWLPTAQHDGFYFALLEKSA
ncbi:16S rRNA (cytosine(967)-C(5))-methyltransferase RsmB [Uliginosibacterium aquaticum]|uniref:16S rRNA (cytosine(967)-C(5))-methyltransferase n=1 Tax=Uliginosibacterium aquaticum TaxID=2731212 RepID=A0ABX2II49_9RHOO|nr:16S rRNA (cytosine(967)-C(5))-methyltransferase RsmB [Uliginosibacterium aquaticum]NSL53710.1 16S rRNA (cytosine(967)-C(5))-methyltransferase RsmB [Uliginosibacterium aquaticum]